MNQRLTYSKAAPAVYKAMLALQASATAEQALALLMRRYKGGADTYLQEVISQTVALQNERNKIDIRRRQMVASVLLLKALGGGWDTSHLTTC